MKERQMTFVLGVSGALSLIALCLSNVSVERRAIESYLSRPKGWEGLNAEIMSISRGLVGLGAEVAIFDVIPESSGNALVGIESEIHILEQSIAALRMRSKVRTAEWSRSQAYLEKIVLSQHYGSLFLSKVLSHENRAKALYELTKLYEPNLHFTLEMEEEWMERVLLSSDSHELYWLALSFRNLGASPRVLQALIELARYSTMSSVRGAALEALGRQDNLPDNGALIEAIMEDAALNDPTTSNREIAANLLKKKRR